MNGGGKPITLSYRDIDEVEEIFVDNNLPVTVTKNSISSNNKGKNIDVMGEEKNTLINNKEVSGNNKTHNKSLVNSNIKNLENNSKCNPSSTNLSNLNNIFSAFNNSSLINSHSAMSYKSTPQEVKKSNINLEHSKIKYDESFDGGNKKSIEKMNNPCKSTPNQSDNYTKFNNVVNINSLKSNFDESSNKINNQTLLSKNSLESNKFSLETANKVYNTSQINPRDSLQSNKNIQSISSPSQDRNNSNLSNKNNINEYSQKASFVFKDYSYKEDRNSKFRNTMEDFNKIEEFFRDRTDQAFFSLYDGHGGADPVKYAKERMPELLSKLLVSEPFNSVESILVNCFKKVDDELKFTDSENSGCTACINFLIFVNNKKVLYTANVGDTRAVLFTDYSFSRLTYDHKCSDTEEAERIRKGGGLIFNGRVFGQLVLSRALGDHSMKKYGVIPIPHVKLTELTNDHKFLIMASDGVWDVLTDDDIFQILIRFKNYTTDQLTGYITDVALKKGSRDNISLILIKLN